MFRGAAGLLGRVCTPGLPVLAAAVLLQEKKARESGPRHQQRHQRLLTWKRETYPCYNLTVKVLRAKNIQSTDTLSKADCYVELRLPTASPVASRTRVIYNSSDPEWNEAFHYHVHGAVKNILELTLYDKDLVLDDELLAVSFDVGRLTPGKPSRSTFPIKPQNKKELEVEFYLEKSNEPPTEVITNGVLVANPCLSVQGTISGVTKAPSKEEAKGGFKMFMAGAYEKEVLIPYTPASHEGTTPFVFHVDGELHPELEVSLQNGMNLQRDEKPDMGGSLSLPVSSFPLGKKVDFTVPLGKEQNVDLSIKAEESHEDLDVRLGFDLSDGEKRYLKMRKPIIAQALKEALKLQNAPNKDEVPVVAVVASGGGTRAMTSFFGNLAALQELNLLDVMTYISGVSGSTWSMSTLYKDPEWSQKDLQDVINYARDSVISHKTGAFSKSRLKYYFQELGSMNKDGRNVSYTDLWGLVIEYFLHQKENPCKLSEQQESVERAQNPYPVYASINVRSNISGSDFAEWCEFTPHEVGLRKYGAFIRTEDFGSEFFMGHLIHRRPELRICYLQGVWSSILAASLDEIWARMATSGMNWINSLKDAINAIDESRRKYFKHCSRLKTQVVTPDGIFSQLYQDVFKSRFMAAESYNFTRGLYLHKNYVGTKEFVPWKDNHLDASPNKLTPMEESLHLVDGGFSINSPFPLMLQPERDVDVILSFNYSWESHFKVLLLTEMYCRERGIPFPKIELNEEDEKKPKECYMFMDAKNPKAPIVIHFPLVNHTFCKYKEPGVKRETEEEKSFGNFLISGKNSPYRSTNFTFEPLDFDRLLEASRYNVLNNRDTILDALKIALHRRTLKNRKEAKLSKTV
ncbi:cytosolic phospholipase A2 zeta [Ambystoma mexicanum]|uniref:cytosolic phospholipase A2 zeta n=1 Tax=Ambystoma mexicanum TaxID=8296 RepID=UPI0037E6FA7C